MDAPFASLGCAKVVQPDSDWVWETMQNHRPINVHSCDQAEANHIRGDGVSMCLNASGLPDHTSIYVDMTGVKDKTGCFAWYSYACPLDLRTISKLEFDIDIKGCGDVWAGPFWLTPSAWYGPGGQSGEIDLIEACPVGNVNNNFAGCDGAQGICHEATIASGGGLGGPKHIVMTLADSGEVSKGGDLKVEVCDLGGSNCRDGGYFTDFLRTAKSTKMRPVGSTLPYYLVSDIWNGLSGDGGWYGCNARNSPATQCQYAVLNIQVHGNHGAHVFNSGGKCTALNDHPPFPDPTTTTTTSTTTTSTTTTIPDSGLGLGAVEVVVGIVAIVLVLVAVGYCLVYKRRGAIGSITSRWSSTNVGQELEESGILNAPIATS